MPLKKIHPAINAPVGGLITYRALPNEAIDHIDPFLFLNHHGPQDFGPNNPGLPFGPHPHRGFETVTFVISGDVVHWDSSGHKSKISDGGIQWMTAGKGVVHSEVSSEEFKRNGGREEILQLWLNLPSKYKLEQARYFGLEENDIPVIERNGTKTQVIAGDYENQAGEIDTFTEVFLSRIDLNKGSSFEKNIPRDHNIFFYIVKGEIEIDNQKISSYNLLEFEKGTDKVSFSAGEDSIVLLGHAQPFGEPIVARGPFVMNTREEISDAIRDYEAGKFENNL